MGWLCCRSYNDADVTVTLKRLVQPALEPPARV